MVAAVDKLLSCCGDNEMVQSLMTKLPWNKNKTDDDEDVADEPTNRNEIKLVKRKKGKFTDAQMKYEVCNWKDLPLKIRRAVQDLGYDQEKWDSSAEEEIDHKHWDDLTEKELKALELMGWDKISWESKYEDLDFKDLPEVVQKAATAAGFTEESWDGNSWPENLEKSWEDLAEEDRQAMAVLGYTARAWD